MSFLGLEGILISAIIGASSGVLKSVIGGEQPACDWPPYAGGAGGGDQWWFRTYTDDGNGNQKAIADVCWTGGGYELGPQDEYVAECLTNLHVEQAFTCIERVGSVCDGPESANTAIATTRMRYGASFDANQQIDDYNRDKIMKSLRILMRENDHGIDIGTRIHIAPRYDEGDITYWNANFYLTGDEGDNAC